MQVAITETVNINELPGSGQAGNTIFGLLLICLGLDSSDRHDLIRTISIHACIGDRGKEKGFIQYLVRRTVPAVTPSVALAIAPGYRRDGFIKNFPDDLDHEGENSDYVVGLMGQGQKLGRPGPSCRDSCVTR
jgi:hypothetical protein